MVLQYHTNGPTHTQEIYVDGSSNFEGSRAKIVITSPKVIVAKNAFHFEFSVTNNVVEYEAMIIGLENAKELRAQYLHVYSDSQLIIGQVNGDSKAWEKNMERYIQKVRELTHAFCYFGV